MTNFYGGIDSSKLPVGSGNGLFWTYGYSTTTPANRYAYVLESDESGLYLFGGAQSGGGILANSYKYTISTNVWSSVTSIPATKKGHCSCRNGDYIYVLGGYNGTIHSNNYRYSISGNSWNTSLASLPVAKWYASASYCNNYIYHFGGLTTTSDSSATSTVYKYDIAGDTWSTLTSSPLPVALGSHRSITVGNYIYIIAGVNSSSITVDTIYRFNTTDETWSTMANLPVTNRWPAVAHYNGNIYIFGGDISNSSTNGSRNFKYNIENNTVEQILPIPTVNSYSSDTIEAPNRTLAQAAVIGNSIWIPFGNLVSNSTVSNSILKLNNC